MTEGSGVDDEIWSGLRERDEDGLTEETLASWLEWMVVPGPDPIAGLVRSGARAAVAGAGVRIEDPDVMDQLARAMYAIYDVSMGLAEQTANSLRPLTADQTMVVAFNELCALAAEARRG